MSLFTRDDLAQSHPMILPPHYHIPTTSFDHVRISKILKSTNPAPFGPEQNVSNCSKEFK